MSRLYRHKQHQTARKIVIMIILAIGLAVFMATIGFQLMINGVVFLNRAINPPDQEEQQDTNEELFLGSINLDEPPSATNSAQIILTGNAQDFETVDIYINNTKVKTISPRGSSFEEQVGSLKAGDNTVYARAKTPDGKNTKDSEVHTIFYKKDPLELEIDSPTPDMTTREQELPLKGTVDPGSTLRVNNQPIVVSTSGVFDTTTRLKEGENTLLFHAEDIAGNIEEVELKVRYERDE